MATISSLGLPCRPSAAAKCCGGRAQMSPSIVLGESLVSELMMEFLGGTFCSPRYTVPFHS